MTKLQLALKAEYFDAIKAGTKPEEYRLANTYWTKRLNYDGKSHMWPRSFSSIVLTKGYPKAGDPERTLELPWRGFTRKTITHPHFGPDPVDVFAIDVRYPPPPVSKVMGSEALVAWRVRHKNDGPHMWEYYLLPREKMLSNDLIYQDLNLRQLLDFLNDDRHANAQERAPEPHAPSYLLEAFRDAWKMANEAGVEDDWEDAFRFWAPPYAVTPYNHAPPVLPKGVYTAPTTQMTSPPPPRK